MAMLASITVTLLAACNQTSVIGQNDGGGGSAGTSGGGDNTTTESTTSTGSDGGSGSGGQEPGCNELEELGHGYAFSAQAPPAPNPEGGAIADGVYMIVSEVAYTNSNQEPADIPQGWTLEVSGNTMNRVVGDVHQTFELSTNGSQLTRTVLCDTQSPETVGTSSTHGYTATGDMFVEFLEWDFGLGPEMELFTWIRVP
jgi:hypothetical protein